MTPTQLTEWRKSLGLNRVNAAKALGMSRNTLAGYEAGDVRIPLYVEYACKWITNIKDE